LSRFKRFGPRTVFESAPIIDYGTATPIAFLVALLAQLSGVMNALGWSAVVIYLGLALGNAYFLLVRPAGT
jgi:hypothetical protein